MNRSDLFHSRSFRIFLAVCAALLVLMIGTAGFGGAPAYFEGILERVRTLLAKDVTVIGSYMCQGKMPQPVRDRYEAMEESPHRTSMLENFDRALSHPDADDLARLKAAVTK